MSNVKYLIIGFLFFGICYYYFQNSPGIIQIEVSKNGKAKAEKYLQLLVSLNNDEINAISGKRSKITVFIKGPKDLELIKPSFQNPRIIIHDYPTKQTPHAILVAKTSAIAEKIKKMTPMDEIHNLNPSFIKIEKEKIDFIKNLSYQFSKEKK